MSRVLVGCECSGRVREALRSRGVDAWSCDLKGAEDGSDFHYRQDVREVIGMGWDGAVFHPDCTYLTNSGVRWLWSDEPSTPEILKGKNRWLAMIDAAMFYRELRDCGIERVIMENPLMHGYAKRIIQIGERQVVQPWWFGEPYLKATGFELVNVAPLIATNRLTPPRRSDDPAKHAAWSAVHRESPGPERRANRSRTYHGVADAIADAMVRSLATELRIAA